jgi:hypothetical protein
LASASTVAKASAMRCGDALPPTSSGLSRGLSGGSTASSRATVAGVKFASATPLSRALSAAMSSGPWPLVMIASRPPEIGLPIAMILAAANSCVYVRTRSVPARISAALNTVSASGAAPGPSVSAQRVPRPALSTTMGLVRAAARSAEMKRRESRSVST